MENKVKILIIGCGGIARAHASYLKDKSDLYFHSQIVEDATAFNKKYNGHGIIETWQDVVARTEINTWIICSPLAVHLEQVLEGIKYGKTILCEKPLCATEQELEQIQSALNEFPQAQLMVAENYCYRSSLAKIQNANIGDLKSLLIRKEFTQISPGWRTQYGALLEGGIHFVALTNAIAKSKVKEVKALFPGKSEVERSSKITIEYQNGVSAQVNYSWETPSLTKGIFQHSKISGTAGEIIFESNGLYLIIKENKKRRFYSNLKDLSGRQALLDDFLKLAADPNHTPVHTIADSIKDLQVVFKAYQQR